MKCLYCQQYVWPADTVIKLNYVKWWCPYCKVNYVIKPNHAYIGYLLILPKGDRYTLWIAVNEEYTELNYHLPDLDTGDNILTLRQKVQNITPTNLSYKIKTLLTFL